jgi:hypothetical protein
MRTSHSVQRGKYEAWQRTESKQYVPVSEREACKRLTPTFQKNTLPPSSVLKCAQQEASILILAGDFLDLLFNAESR